MGEVTAPGCWAGSSTTVAATAGAAAGATAAAGAAVGAAIVTIWVWRETRTSSRSFSPYSRFTASSVRSFLLRSSASAWMKATSLS